MFFVYEVSLVGSNYTDSHLCMTAEQAVTEARSHLIDGHTDSASAPSGTVESWDNPKPAVYSRVSVRRRLVSENDI